MSTATICEPRINHELSVVDLLDAISEGDSSAWEELVYRYGGLVTAAVRSFRLPHADALDAVQSTWMHLVENHRRVRHPEHLGGWLVTTARRECLRILRHTKRTVNAGVAINESPDHSVDPEHQVVSAVTAETLRKLVAELTPRQQRVLCALFVDEHPYAAISRVTGIPQGSIGPTRIRALTVLRQRLCDHGLA